MKNTRHIKDAVNRQNRLNYLRKIIKQHQEAIQELVNRKWWQVF